MDTQDLYRNRAESSLFLNGLSGDQLFEAWNITRVGSIDGLDVIGIPVWSACRPLGKVVSVYAGKSRNQGFARSGAIAEAIEYHTFENPVGEFHMEHWNDYQGIPVTTHFEKHDKIPIDYFIHYVTAKPETFPAHLLWLDDLGYPKIADSFHRSSNGNAIGPTFEDALLAGIYECVERDALTIHIKTRPRHLRVMPRPEVEDLVEKIEGAGLGIYLEYCSLDIRIPVFLATITSSVPGEVAYSGWGTDLDSAVAQEKAILEAIQSRAVYIAGARDDINRTSFLERREVGHQEFTDRISKLPPIPVDRVNTSKWESGTKLLQVTLLLKEWVTKLYYRHIPLECGLHAVKTFIRGLEPPALSEMWTSNGRVKALCERR